MLLVQAEHLTKKYGACTAVEDVSFTLKKGEICGLVGVNGAGKSTTMNMLTGYLAPTEGAVLIDGVDMLENPEEAKKNIGYLPEQPPLYGEMTPKEYLCFAAQLKKLPKKEQKQEIARVIKLCGLEEVSDRLMKQLSKGYRQRVGFAQALLGHPKLLVLDEPTAGLDPKQTVEMRRFILTLKKECAVLLSSHILSEVDAVCDRILILSKGQLAADGTGEELSSLLQGNSSYYLRAKGDKKAICAVLNTVDGLRVQEAKEDKGETTLVFTTGKKEDPRPEVGYRLAEKRLPVLELHKENTDFEEVFLQLVEKEE